MNKVKKLKGVFTLDMNSKPTGYYGSIREEMFVFIENNPQRTLEFGCGEGGFSSIVKQRFGAETWAVEINTCAAQMASRNLFKVICCSAEESITKLPDKYFDNIYLFDFLEHLVDPYTLLKQLKKKMSDSGVIIASIPNIRHYKTALEYLWRGDWSYRDAGILDITHLRFFTYKSIIRTLEALDFRIQKIQGIHKSGNHKLNLLNFLLLGKLDDMKYQHFVVVASPDNQ
jgi:2-polyprenyl-3-methyl-5-hydroxy-6-metoxy-1,4-benzoquinol methylase